jgi:acid phosphatase type 7
MLAALLAPACSGLPRAPTGWTDPEPDSPFVTGPYILLGDPGIAHVAVKAPDLPDPPIVRWWNADQPAGPQTEVAAERIDDLWVATLKALPIGAHIAYQVVWSNGVTDPERFRVGVAPGESFRFAAFGDTRTGHSVHREVIEAVTRERVEFVIHTGDMVDRGGVQEQWDLFFQIERPLLRRAPIIPSIGNHDLGARQYYRRYFLHRLWAKNLRYYYTDWGNLRIVAMDGGIECRDGCTQYAFVDRALAEGARQGKLMVMSLHFPPYSSGAHGSHLGVQTPVAELARRHGVELVIAGHDHNYERTKPISGTTFVVSGSAGAPIRPVRPRWFTAHARTEPHYVLVDVEANRMVVRAINLHSETFDRAIITPNPARE